MSGEAAMRQSFTQRQSPTVALFSTALFNSAYLMFMLQPMLGKMLLPLVGGTPSGWLVAMAFFQIMLVAGYALAHRLSRLSPLKHFAAYICALCLGGFFLPLTLHGNATDGAGVLWLLTQSAAVPFIALAMTSSTLQRMFMASGHDGARDPYFLYAASNLGSFAGLLLYPLAAETLLTIPQQSALWVAGYVLLVAICGFCALQLKDAKPSAAAPAKTAGDWRWVAFAFIPSSLMMGVTSEITTAIVAAPLLWVLPLAVYLLTFIVAFGNGFPRAAAVASRLHPAAVCLAHGLIFLASVSLDAPWTIMALHLACFGVVALAFHARLAARRPLGDSGAMTKFYLMVAVGGALGGILNAFIAPAVFNRPLEYPLVLLLSLLFATGLREKFSLRNLIAVGVALGGMALWAALREFSTASPAILEILLIAIFMAAAWNARFALIACALLAANELTLQDTGKLDLYVRNFYGLIRVYDRSFVFEGQKYDIRYFGHGTTIHGMQSLDPDIAEVPTAYFSHGGPVGDIFHTFHPKNVAVLGLGAGTLACQNAPDRKFTFIEIDPDVVKIAREQFSFLAHCNGAQPPRIITGDGRLELAKLKGEKFDLIVLDAFSSDMVPVHLVSTEAIELYKTLLAEGGVLAFNISNNYVTLATTLAAGARDTGLRARFKDYQFIDPPLFLPSEWLVMAKDAATLQPLAELEWMTPPPAPRSWTDNFSNILTVMRL